MTNNVVIEVKNLDFTFYRLNPLASSLKKLFSKELKALYSKKELFRDLNLEIKSGEIVGIIGRNGAGKSTLLKLISGLLPPESGKVVVKGKVAPLIELGTAFHMELTAKENIELNSFLLKNLDVNVEETLNWAGLSREINDPLRTFSSGMLARLAFAIATNSKPDILIIDEVLSVGDADFQRKSLKRMESLIKSGCTVVIVSHNIELLESICTNMIWIEKGRLMMFGKAAEVANAYRKVA